MKFLILATLVALCTALPYHQGRNIAVNDDGTVWISTQNGRHVFITGTNGQRNIQIAVAGPTIPTQVIQFDDEGLVTYGNQGNLINAINGQGWGTGNYSPQGQAALLAAIFGQYQGVVNHVLYQQLLNQISHAMNNGQINPHVYPLLEELEQIEDVMNALAEQGHGQVIWGPQGFSGLQNGFYGPGHGYPVGVQAGSFGSYQHQFPVGQGILSALINNQWGTSHNVNPLWAKVWGSNQVSGVNNLLNYPYQQHHWGGVAHVLGNHVVNSDHVPLVQGGAFVNFQQQPFSGHFVGAQAGYGQQHGFGGLGGWLHYPFNQGWNPSNVGVPQVVY